MLLPKRVADQNLSWFKQNVYLYQGSTIQNKNKYKINKNTVLYKIHRAKICI